jgi:glycerol-3-phosphate acyltransferase PlsY
VTSEILLPPILSFLLGYLLGAIPFGLLLTRGAGLGDVRDIGSGNIGATNVLRTGRKGLAAGTLLLDAAKGAGAVLIAAIAFPALQQAPVIAAIGAFLGHLFPLWLGFKGGKGVATLIGIIAALCWAASLIMLGVWLLMFVLTRFSSVAGMSAAIAAPAAAFFLGRFELVLPFAGLALLVLWKHRANIGRLIRRTEPRVGQSAG